MSPDRSCVAIGRSTGSSSLSTPASFPPRWQKRPTRATEVMASFTERKSPPQVATAASRWSFVPLRAHSSSSSPAASSVHSHNVDKKYQRRSRKSFELGPVELTTTSKDLATIRLPKLSMGCQTSKDVLPVSPNERRPSINEIFLQAASKQIARDESGVGAGRPPATDSHRDVFSIFGERGMPIDVPPRESLLSPASSTCPPISPSGSVFSTATTASDTERTLVLRRPAGQYFPQLRLSYGVYSNTGVRRDNEDRQTSTSQMIDDDLVAFFGLYDGHGGSEVAEYLARNFHENVFKYLRKAVMNEVEKARSVRTPDKFLREAVRRACGATDEEIIKAQLPSGSTAVSVVVRGSTALVSSVGDSQVVLSTNGQAKDMCIAHTPQLSSERERILAAKGQVSKGRIYGMLGVSRAFGDIDFKTGRGEFKSRFNGDLVSATPDIVVHEIKSQDEFMVLGCDGLFDVMKPQDVVNFVRTKLGLHGDVQHATEEVVSHAIALGSTDNVSAIIVCFNQNEQEVAPVTPIEAAQAAEAQKKRGSR